MELANELLSAMKVPSALSSSPPSLQKSRASSPSSSTDPLSMAFDDARSQGSPDVSFVVEHNAADDPAKPKSYGGLCVLTWRDYRKNLDNFKPRYQLARDLPHGLQDGINALDPALRALPTTRGIFEAAILANTAHDEPTAPHIQVLNMVDDEPTPPWEFHYSNEVWLGDGVPPPDVTRLTNCGCVGVCDPRSKTCACVQRQVAYTGEFCPAFAYGKTGKLEYPGIPIFECNDLCGCGEECMNRVRCTRASLSFI